MSKSKRNAFKPVPGHPGIYKRTTKDGVDRWGAKAYDPSAERTVGEGQSPLFGRTVWIGTFDTRKEARVAKGKFEAEAARLGFRKAGKTTVAQYAATWLERHSAGRAESTLRTYRYGIKPFVTRFGSVRIRDLDRTACVDWSNTQADWAVDAARNMLSDMRDLDRLILVNPLEKLRRKRSRGRKDWPSLGDIEVQGLIDSALQMFVPEVGRPVAGIIATSAYLGLRKSEAVALSMDCVDPVSKRILVDLQVGRQRVETGPKTGERVIALTPKADEVWSGLDPRSGPGSMFPMDDGQYWEVSNFYDRWVKVAAASGIPGLQFHELRGYCATWLKRQGVEEWVVGVQLGHAIPGNKITQGYIKARDFALEQIDDLLSGELKTLEPQGRRDFRPRHLLKLDPRDTREREEVDDSISRQERRRRFMDEAKANRDRANDSENEYEKGSEDQE